MDSALYLGNVTIRVDPTWGVSQTPGTTTRRSREAKYTLQYYEYDVSRLNKTSRAALASPYDRCKANRRYTYRIHLIHLIHLTLYTLYTLHYTPHILHYTTYIPYRCNWGVVEHDQYTNDVQYYHRLFDRGTLYKMELFLNFEDWRIGTRGLSWDGFIPPSDKGSTSIPKVTTIHYEHHTHYTRYIHYTHYTHYIHYSNLRKTKRRYQRRTNCPK